MGTNFRAHAAVTLLLCDELQPDGAKHRRYAVKPLSTDAVHPLRPPKPWATVG
ncbi:hypothetical protein MIZ03_3224 [Rhodoferax lithotrophicus]|uniref:Uncharacterized protein n=1 Tax=Rhodoferax lithotrophicus TaxID=2798804 RepID=A0ABN6DBL1_9BURK|nr:hypothetical protein MIZ03_3224 [Rhodoferax sp. MIZ03]